MEKTEYLNKIEEMRGLLDQGLVDEALDLADSINWRKVHNVNTLVDVSEIYEIAGELEDARSLLVLAHNRSPIGRMIIFRLAMLSIKMKDFENAVEYYNKFVDIAPHDSLKYIIKYNLFVAQGMDDLTIIEVLEQFKEADFIEEWAYELAYLYHKNGMVEKCIDLCDDIILWFGEGICVERALELKMLYQPLDKNQEDKYRHAQQKKDGITEIMANEELLSGEIVPHTVAIPSVELPADKFNTINLQAEIKKNIDEIMKATEAGEVVENMDAINRLVEEIPYLQVKEEEVEEQEDDLIITQKEEPSINDVFQEYLKEEYDGQITFLIPDSTSEDEEPIEGQITIDDIIADWEKTRRAAQQALEDAEKKRLEDAREKAIKEANHVLNRLEEAMPKLDAGMTSTELLREEYLKDLPQATVSDDPELPGVFIIPSVDGSEKGIEIPVIHPDANTTVLPEAQGISSSLVQSSQITKDTTSWKPPVLNDNSIEKKAAQEKYALATRMLADVNAMLQEEIDKFIAEEEEASVSKDSTDEIIKKMAEVALELDTDGDGTISVEEIIFANPMNEKESDVDRLAEEIDIIIDDSVSDMIQTEELDVVEEVVEEPEEPKSEEEPKDFEVLIPSQDEELDTEDEEIEDDIEPDIGVVSEEAIAEANGIGTEYVGNMQVVAHDESEESYDSYEEEFEPIEIRPNFDFTDADLEPFSYFAPVQKLKGQLLDALNGTKYYITSGKKYEGGNLVIQGERGTGKTKLATAFVEVLQNTTDNAFSGNTGMIDGRKLNAKNHHELFEKIRGGCLIIENAGEINKETAMIMSLLMQSDRSGILIILEDTEEGLDKVMNLDGNFSAKFTEKIIIPELSIDELVGFAEAYAYENGFVMEDMGRLALYNRINMIQRYNHVTSVKEVADIMDEAMDNGEKISIFKKHKKDEEGNIILVEKDFGVD